MTSSEQEPVISSVFEVNNDGNGIHPPSLPSEEDLKVETEQLKQLGNNAYKNGQYQEAVNYFTQAIDLIQTDATFFLNRSLAYASLKEWKLSAIDAKRATKINPKYVKAHFRLVKALFAMEHYRDARACLSFAFKETGESKELKVLEEEIYQLTKIPLRPKPTDFEIIHELGSGNYSSIYKVHLKATNDIYAIKVS